jgi:hypothetical protein
LKKYFFLFLVAFVTGCSNNKKEMNLNVIINGFKKGNIYLQKIQDSTLINIDSIFIENNKSIVLKHQINSPQIFFINLDISKKDNRIEFFGEEGDITIKTNLKNFSSEFEVSGSYNDSIYRKYLNIIKQFNYRRLDLIKKSFEMSQSKDLDSIKLIESEIENLNKRQYLYSLNYAVTNGNSHVAPFIALNEFSQGGKVLLDTIKNSLSKDVLSSKYGAMLKKTVEEL